MFDVGDCQLFDDDSVRVVVWDTGNVVLTSKGEMIPSSEFQRHSKFQEFFVHEGVYTKLAKMIEGVRVSEFLRPGDVLMIFSDDFSKITLDLIVEKDFENNHFITQLGKVVIFGSIMGVYAYRTVSL